MDEKCPFEDPEVVADLVAISNKLREALRAHKAKVRIVLWALILGTALPALVLGRMGVEMKVPGWRGVVLIFLAPLPLLGIVMWQVIGERRVARKVYREEGLHCLGCDRVPTGRGGDDLETWIAGRRCPHCEGPLERFETRRSHG